MHAQKATLAHDSPSTIRDAIMVAKAVTENMLTIVMTMSGYGALVTIEGYYCCSSFLTT